MSQVTRPTISVLMAVYNGQNYLEQSVRSILYQTFTDFEFIIINDGSTDKTQNILQKLSANDKRISLISQNNQGLAHSLNTGIKLAKGMYIARMDCDDVSSPMRLEKQLAFMNANPQVDVCGTWFDIIEQSNSIIRTPISDEDIRVALFWQTPVAHPSVMFRKEPLIEHNIFYDKAFPVAQDYQLWVTLSPYCRFANIPEVLLHYRSHPGQASSVKKNQQEFFVELVRLQQVVSLLGRKITDKEKSLHELLYSQSVINDFTILKQLKEWITLLVQANNTNKIYPEPGFSSHLIHKEKRFFRTYYGNKIMKCSKPNFLTLWRFWFSKDRPYSFFGKKERLKLAAACILPGIRIR